MKKLYSFGKVRSFAVTVALALSTTAFSQDCGVVVESFTNTGGSTAGFTGGLVYGTSAGDGFLVKDRVLGNATYTVTSPTYRLPAGATSVGYGFELSGTERVTTVRASVIYVAAANGEIITFSLGTFPTSYNGATPASAFVCRTVSTTELPGGLSGGGSYRLQFEFTPGTGNGAPGQNFNFDDFRTNGGLAPAPLPVTFMSLDSRKLSAGVQLNWKVAGEENVIRYEIERSTDGRNFTYVGSLATSKTDNYSYLDPANNSVVYYRVKNVDANGHFKYSSVVRLVDGKSDIVIKVFPQPVINVLTLQHPAIEKGGLITLSAADGRQVKAIRPGTGSIQTSVDMSTLQSGVYFLRLDAGKGSATNVRVLKQ